VNVFLIAAASAARGLAEAAYYLPQGQQDQPEQQRITALHQQADTEHWHGQIFKRLEEA